MDAPNGASWAHYISAERTSALDELRRRRGKNRRRHLAAMLEQDVGFAVAVEGADVNVGLSRLDPLGASAERQVRVHERAEVLVRRIAALPQLVQLMEHRSGHLERAPHPRPIVDR